jgi:hypothetical protein
MAMLSILEEKEAIRDLLATYSLHLDGGELDKWLELFSEDGTFDVGPLGRAQGRQGINDFLSRIRLATGKVHGLKHHTFNSIITVDGTGSREQLCARGARSRSEGRYGAGGPL